MAGPIGGYGVANAQPRRFWQVQRVATCWYIDGWAHWRLWHSQSATEAFLAGTTCGNLLVTLMDGPIGG